MSTFSTTVTQAQRDAIDHNLHGRAISQASRQNTLRPGYNRSPFEPKVSEYRPRPASSITGQLTTAELKQPTNSNSVNPKIQVRPHTKRGQRRVESANKHPRLGPLPTNQFYEAGCELLHTGNNLQETIVMFLGVQAQAGGDVCTTGCAWFDNGTCPAYKKLLTQKILTKKEKK